MGKRGTQKLRRKDSDSYSSMSAPATVDKKPPRFSLRRIFAGRTLSAKSNRSRTSLEIDTKSEISLNSSQLDKIDLVPTDTISQSASTSQPIHVPSNGLLTCPLCISMLPHDSFPVLMTCPHRSCQDCLKQYLRIEITESRVNISCPECSERLHPSDIKSILCEDSLMEKYEEFMLRRVLVSDPDTRWCPAPDCGFAVIATGCAGCPKLKCERPGCDSNFCYHCKQFWHPNLTCDAARARRSPSLAATSNRRHANSAEPTAEIKPCPRCSACIMKMDDGSCNHMTCAVCGAEFCWLCMKEISDLHYLSPSGCTFWGKKPWSRKKKILWQLGTLVGAPVGIGLIAGIAVPAMIIGIPIWVARKLHAKYEMMPKHKRNAVITGGVMASIIVSPIVAGLAVGVGVPILLAYVYGVVPISLCRSGGGCGVKTTESGGVRFDFDDDNDVTVGISSGGAGDSHSIEVNSQHAITEPSIGPSIGEMSVDMTKSLSASGSHVDRMGILRDESDRDSASNRAIAGASLDGSLCGCSVLGNKLEVHADVANYQKRASISSESANLSLGSEKSHNANYADNASTKALAGSIGGNRDNSSAIIPPVDGHTDLRRHNSGSSNGTTLSHPRNPSNHGSPISGRSVSFSGDESRVRRTKKFKRCSFGGVDRNSVDSGERMDKLSIGSYDLEVEHGDTLSLPSKHGGGDERKNGSHESVESRTVVTTGVATLTQVEVDKPQYAIRTINKTVKDDCSLVEGPVLCNIVEEKKLDSNCKDESLRVRRRSCEMALDQGRLIIDAPKK